MEVLLSRGADVLAATNQGKTSLDLAQEPRSVEHLHMLLCLTRPTPRGPYRDCPRRAPVTLPPFPRADQRWYPIYRIKARLKEAMESAYEEALSATESTPKVESVLRFHAAAGDVTHMLELLERGVVNVEGREEGGNEDTALHVAASGGHMECLKLLLTEGADMETKAGRGWTVLHIAALRGHAKVVECLIEKGADLEAEDEWGRTPLMCAKENGHDPCAELLQAAMNRK